MDRLKSVPSVPCLFNSFLRFRSCNQAGEEMQWQLLRAAILRLIRLAAGFGLPDLRRHAYPQGEARKTPCGARQNRGKAAGPIKSSGIVALRSRDCGTDEMNDHPQHLPAKCWDRIRLIAIET